MVSQLMQESDDIASKRQRCTAALAALQEALTTLECLPANLMSQVSNLYSLFGVVLGSFFTLHTGASACAM